MFKLLTYPNNLKLMKKNRISVFWTGVSEVLKIGVVGNVWLVGWLVSNAVFSETALRTFLIFCMKLGDYKDRKVTESDFWEKFFTWRYSRKGFQISPKSDTFMFFSKTARTTFFCFWPEVSTKYYLQFEWNIFFTEIYNLKLFDLKIVKKLSKLRFLVIFWTLHH